MPVGMVPDDSDEICRALLPSESLQLLSKIFSFLFLSGIGDVKPFSFEPGGLVYFLLFLFHFYRVICFLYEIFVSKVYNSHFLNEAPW